MKRESQPPALHDLMATWLADPASEHLRLGQYFINKYMPNIDDGPLYTCESPKDALLMLRTYYLNYQWEM